MLERKLAVAGGNQAVQGIIALRELGLEPAKTLSFVESAAPADPCFPAGGTQRAPGITVRAFDNRRSPVRQQHPANAGA